MQSKKVKTMRKKKNQKFFIHTWMLNVNHEGKLVYAVESHGDGKVYLLENAHAGYALLGYLSDLDDAGRKTIMKHIEKMLCER